MTREYCKAMLPFFAAYANGEAIETHDACGTWRTLAACNIAFNRTPDRYRIAKPKERVPLEAEDWIKDGPWWYRSNEYDIVPKLVSSVGPMSIGWNNSECRHDQAMNGQRRNAVSDWMPCWKEEE